MANTKNYAEQGGEKTVIGGELIITGTIKAEEGSTVEGFGSNPYVLPTASADTLGGVKVGTGLTIADGVLSVDVEALKTLLAE